MIQIDASQGEQALQQTLARLSRMGGDFSGLMADIGEYLKLSTRLRFDRTETPDGQQWAPNSPNTPKFGIAKPLHGKTLNLRDGMVYQASASQLIFGPGQATKAYAAIHQFGGLAGRGHKVVIPARRYLGISATDRRIILKKLMREIDLRLRSSGGI